MNAAEIIRTIASDDPNADLGSADDLELTQALVIATATGHAVVIEAIEAEQVKREMSLRPRPGETAQDTLDRVIRAAGQSRRFS